MKSFLVPRNCIVIAMELVALHCSMLLDILPSVTPSGPVVDTRNCRHARKNVASEAPFFPEAGGTTWIFCEYTQARETAYERP